MKRIFRRNQIIITTLAVMIAAAGYLNYSSKKEVAGAEVYEAGMMDISDADILAENQAKNGGNDGKLREIAGLDGDREELLPEIRSWIASGETYTIRYGIGMLMTFYLDEDFRPEYLKMPASVRSEEYYVNMARAWYFATALAKKYDQVLPFLEEQKMDVWTHNKTIQKAIESYRITTEQKEYLRALKIKQ